MWLSVACVRRWTIRLRPSLSKPFAGSAMFSKPTERRSIAWQLILLFTVATSLLLACGLGLFYAIVVRHAFAEDNAVLADKIAALRTDLYESGPNVFAKELKGRHAGEHTAYWIRMLDSQGRTYAETPGMDRSLPPEIFPPPQDSASMVGGLKDYRRGSKLFSLVAVNEESGSQRYTLQLAQDRSSDERLERNFAALFIIVLAGSVLGSAFIAIVVTKRGLRPLQEMTQSFGRIGPTHLKERVTPADWPRELQPLAIAFDEMLKRLDDSFTRLSQFYADSDLFERALGNLLDNALRFTPENGSIQIALSKRDADFEITVRDNGCGIAPEHLPRVFDRFYRADSSRGSDGAGLGLALVKSIVDLHGGSAKIESEIGRGTIVTLTFPLR